MKSDEKQVWLVFSKLEERLEAYDAKLEEYEKSNKELNEALRVLRRDFALAHRADAEAEDLPQMY